jgi:hypothetical protein
MATPGQVIGVGKLITPGGKQGPKGDAGTAVPLADTTQNGLLRQISGKTTDFVDGTNHCQDLVSAIQLIRSRGYNAIGNPTFEVDQRVSGATGNFSVSGAMNYYQCDRWRVNKTTATGAFTAQKQDFNGGAVRLPGTNFFITNSILTLNVTTAQATLAAGELVEIYQPVEGPMLRELVGDTHSISLLVSSSVALNFTVAVTDSTSVKSLVLPCSVPGGNIYTLITLPNLPVWPGGVTWNTSAGTIGYYLQICLGAGSTYTTPVANTWQTGNFLTVAGASNWLANAGATFSFAFVQHEPGPTCGQLIDKPFAQNLDECQRYFQKSYDYATPVGTVTDASSVICGVGAGLQTPYFWTPYRKSLARVPTAVSGWSPRNYGTIPNTVANASSATNLSITGVQGNGTNGFGGFLVSGPPTTAWIAMWHWQADTGW